MLRQRHARTLRMKLITSEPNASLSKWKSSSLRLVVQSSNVAFRDLYEIAINLMPRSPK